MGTNLAISYQRWSTKGQVKGDTKARQSTSAEDYAKRHGLVLDTSFVDAGVSAFRGKNASEGALKALLDAIDAGTIPSDITLLVESLDRISRANIMDALPLFMSIVNRGVTVVTLADGERAYTRESIIKDNGMSLFASMMVLIRAHEESAIKSMRVKSAKANALKAGKKNGKCPFWLEPTADRMAFVVLETNADLVRTCFRMRLEGTGSLRIAKFLNENHSFKWDVSQVVRLLKNPAVIGTRISQAGLEPLVGYYPAIVDKAVFYDVQRLLTAPIGTRRGKVAEDEPNLFTGLMRCSACGGVMRFFRATRNVNYRYVCCASAIVHAGCTQKSHVNYDALEKELIMWLLIDQDEDFFSLLEKKPSRHREVSAELQALREQQARLIDLAASGVLNTTLVAEKLNALELRMKEHERTIDAEAPEASGLERAWALVERHENAEHAVAAGEAPTELHAVRRELKAAFSRSLERVIIYPENRVGDVHHCKVGVQLRGYDGVTVKEYTRPALTRIKGVWNGA